MKGRITVLALVTLTLLTGCASQRSVDTISANGHRLYRLGNYEAAASEFEEITDRYPGDWRAQYMLGRSKLQMGEYTAARRSLEIARTRRPNNPDINEAIARVMAANGNEEEAFAMMRRHAAERQTVDAWLRLARFSMDMGDPDSARLAINTAIRIDNGRTVAPYLAASDLAKRVGDREQAIRRLRQAYGIDPANVEVAERLRSMGEVPGPTIAVPPGA